MFEAWKESASTLLVLPTGCGKTVVMGHIIKQLPAGRAMVIAHREELIWQAAQKIKTITGDEPDIEMAEFRADRTMFGRSKTVVASVQSLVAGAGDGRMARFNPDDFGILLIDEAHHATADTYREILNHFRKNKKLRVGGVTATPDRADEKALGQIFDSVAYNYEIVDAINDGWLVPIEQQSVIVDGLDFSSIRTTAGDLNGADLAEVMEYEKVLHGVASPTIEIVGKRKALVFTASLAHAERFCEILNRHESGCAQWVSGATPKENRRDLFADYASKKFQYLVNVGVATEGFDDPSIEVIVMAKPTKSRSLYAQMAGRGTRPLPGIVDQYDDADDRRMAIAESAKPCALILDFVGNSGKHKLMSVADILGGEYDDAVVDAAAQKAREAGKSINMLEALKQSAKEAHDKAEREKAAEASRRAAIRVKANYSSHSVNPFDVFQIAPAREKGWDSDKPISDKMKGLLEKQGIETEDLTYSQAKQLIVEITKRWDKNECSFKQAKLLQRHGLPGDVSRDQAKQWIDQIAVNQWKLPDHLKSYAVPKDPVEVF